MLRTQMNLLEISDHFIYNVVPENSITIDIGANVGKFANAYSKIYNNKIYSVEPDPVSFNQITETLSGKKFNYAISNNEGFMPFYISTNSEANSFNRKIAEQWGVEKRIDVECISFSNFVKGHNISTDINILKIDAEGSEIEIFASLKNEELKSIAQITVEFHELLDKKLLIPTLAIFKRLNNLNFVPVILSEGNLTSVLFLNREKVSLKNKFHFFHRLHKILLQNSLRFYE